MTKNEAFINLKMKLNTHLREDRTVALWNELREQAKLEYDPEVIRMLDASGFIVKWLDK
jgi:hypothetical protein